MNEIQKKFKFWLRFLSVRWYHHEEASTLHIQPIDIGMKKMSFNLKQYDVGIVTMKYNFDGVGQSIMIIVFFMSNNTSSSGIFYLMQLHVELYIVNELCTLHRLGLNFWVAWIMYLQMKRRWDFYLCNLLIPLFCMLTLTTILYCLKTVHLRLYFSRLNTSILSYLLYFDQGRRSWPGAFWMCSK